MKRRRTTQRNSTSSSSSSSSSSIVPRDESSAELVGSVDDLLREILLKLPIKSLVHFKLVCKPWLSLISNPRFFPNPNPPRGIFFGYISRFQYIPLYPNNDSISCEEPRVNLHFNTHDEILASCNGLMLYSRRDDHKTIYVYNPTINCSTALPPDSEFNRLVQKGVSIAFDPVKSQHYKVVIVFKLDRGRTDQGTNIRKQKTKFILRIYSTETHEWSTGGEVASPTLFTYFRFKEGVYWNGCIHWLGNLRYETPRISLRFHVDNLMLSEMASPPLILENHGRGYYCFGEETRYYFGESGDRLNFAKCILPQFNIYELARDYSEWFVKYKVDLSSLITRYPEVESFRKYVAYILSIVRGKSDDSDSVLVLRTPRKAIKFNLVDGSLEELCDFSEDISDDYVYLDEEDPEKPVGGFIDGYGIDYIPCLTRV